MMPKKKNKRDNDAAKQDIKLCEDERGCVQECDGWDETRGVSHASSALPSLNARVSSVNASILRDTLLRLRIAAP